MTIITLTTDFGLTDSYVAQMKGVILGMNPDARLVDICHTIEPQNIMEAAFVLGTAVPHFPAGSVHLAVVDPGVGTARRAVIVRISTATFVAPDNGILSCAVDRDFEAIAITRSEFWRHPVSSTFHGRDIFAPVAARLSLGQLAITFGERVDSIVRLPLSQPRRTAPDAVSGNIIHIDAFGNLVTNIRETDLPVAGAVTVEFAGCRLALCRSYGEGGDVLALIGSSGYLEIAARNASASRLLGARIGNEVTVRGG